ncbi:MAG: hypothetical protein N3B16_08265 [Candidatus Aminicenantes bacterium]|nr:hypothetical protein [Candidatus Aminicenantes bacterium]
MTDLRQFEQTFIKTFKGQTKIALLSFGFIAFIVIIEEILRYSSRPFYGWGGIAFSQLSKWRYLIYAFSVAVLISMRLIQGILTRISPEIDFHQALQRLSLGTLIPICLAEVPAILGFIFFLLTGLVRDFYVLTIVSVILLFMYFPRKSLWQEKLGRFFS